MEIKLQKGKVKDVLNVISKVVPSNPTMPILGGILIEIEENELSFYATDLSVGLEAKVEVDKAKQNMFEGETKAVVPAKYFKQYINKIDTQGFTLELNKEKVEIRTDNGVMELSTYPADEFPQKKNINGDVFELEQGILKDMLNRTSFCAAKDSENAKSAMMGTDLILGDKLKTVATDSYRLSYYENGDFGKEDNEYNIILPSKTTDILTKMLNEGKVKAKYDLGSIIKFKVGDYVLTSRTISGNFPNYDIFFIDNPNMKIEVDKDKFKGATERAMILNENGVVKYSFGEILKVEEAGEQSGHVLEEMEAELEGEFMEVNLDGQYVLDAIKKFSGNKVVIKGINEQKQFIFKDSDNNNWQYIVMPVRV